MEGRLSNKKAEPDKGEIKLEARASASGISPSEDEDEPPPLEEVSEPHSKASTPRLSSRRSEEFEKGYSPSAYSKKGDSPSSNLDRVRSPSSSYAEEGETASSYTGSAHSSPPHTEKPSSPPPHVNDPRHKGVENNISADNDPPPKHREANNSHTKVGIGSNTDTAPNEKLDAKSSIRSTIPSITHSVVSAAKHVSFKLRSPSIRSSSAVYGSSSSWRKGSPRQMKIVEVALRFGGAVLALITFSVMASTSERRDGAGSTFKMKFTDYQAYNYLVAVNIISLLYSCGQLFLLGQSRVGGMFTNTRDTMLFTYIADQVLAFLLFSASTAAATAAQLSRSGLHNIWPPACSTWKLFHFCSQADAAVVMSFFSSFFVIVSAVFSGYQASHSLLE